MRNYVLTIAVMLALGVALASRPGLAVAGNAPDDDEEQLEVCAGESLPGGYLKTDSYFDSRRCDGDSIAEHYEKLEAEPPGNVWEFTRYVDLPRGSELEICAGASVPNGWHKIDSYFDSRRCDGDYLADKYDKLEQEPPGNVWLIRRR